MAYPVARMEARALRRCLAQPVALDPYLCDVAAREPSHRFLGGATQGCYLRQVALIRALALPPAHFVGLSMGGFVGMRIAARHPGLLRSLALLDTSADPEPAENVPRYRLLNAVARWFGLQWVIGRVMPIMFGRTFLTDPAKAGDRAHWRAQLAGNRRSIYRAVNGVVERAGVAGELGHVRCPTLVVVGEEDVATVPAKSERIAQLIAGAELVRIPGAGHSSSVEQPEAVTAALAGFLARVDGAPA